MVTNRHDSRCPRVDGFVRLVYVPIQYIQHGAYIYREKIVLTLWWWWLVDGAGKQQLYCLGNSSTYTYNVMEMI